MLQGQNQWVLTLLYLRSAKLAPSRTPASVSDGVVRDV